MKLNDVRPNIESSGQMEEQFFSIKDQGMIFDILRSKMYSNPILAICREISCNARDAHREVGKPEVPIQIVLPNVLDWNYRVKDFGPGISPDRMSNIFIQYTASTKREDNIQTGGFGLGAKTPFSYSDSFAIVTVFNGIKYQYNCYIDETKVGKLALLSQENTSEPNGTEIIIPAEPKDAKLFAEWTEHACRHWTVKPIIKGNSIVWKTPKIVLEGKGWAISSDVNNNNNNNNNNNYYHHQAKMVIDGIEYPLSLDALRTYASTQLIDACRGDVIMYFDIGELSLSASREQIYLDEKTKIKIQKRLEEMQADIKKLVDVKIDTFPNLWVANIYYRQELSNAFNNISFLGKLKWKNIELHNSYLSIPCPAFSFTRGKYSRKHGTDPNKLSRSRITSIRFDENSEIFINDLPIKEPTPRHIKKAFEDNPKLQSVQVLCPTDTVTEDYLNKTIHLDSLGPRRLSDITKASGRAYTAASSRLLVFKFDPTHMQYRQVSYSSIEEDTNDKVLCILDKEVHPPYNRQPMLSKNKQIISANAIKAMINRNPGVSFYGIDKDLPADRVKEEFGDFEAFDDFINNKIFNDVSINYTQIKLAIEYSYRVNEHMVKNLAKLETMVLDNDSIFLKRARLYKKIQNMSGMDTGLLHLYETINGVITKKQQDQWVKDNPDCNLDKVDNECMKTYPLLGSINHYNFDNLLDHITQYINLIDSSNKNQNTIKNKMTN